MTEEPYRWLEAIGNRREYVVEQLKEGTPVLAASLDDGILLLGVGYGQSKVFELFDRHALAALGHPADIEKIRQASLDSAHLEAFSRAAEDVSLRRLVSFGLSPQLKTNFEQLFSAPFLVEFLFAEVAADRRKDVLARLHFDGTFHFQTSGVVVASGQDVGSARRWLETQLAPARSQAEVVDLLLQAWWCLLQRRAFEPEPPPEEERVTGWREAVKDKVVEIGWLARQSPRRAHYRALTLEEVGL